MQVYPLLEMGNPPLIPYKSKETISIGNLAVGVLPQYWIRVNLRVFS